MPVVSHNRNSVYATVVTVNILGVVPMLLIINVSDYYFLCACLKFVPMFRIYGGGTSPMFRIESMYNNFNYYFFYSFKELPSILAYGMSAIILQNFRALSARKV
jgi:hypothetical protein